MLQMFSRTFPAQGTHSSESLASRISPAVATSIAAEPLASFAKRKRGAARSLFRRGVLPFLSVSVFLYITGCGATSATEAGSISITDPNGIIAGQLASLSIGRAARVSMTPINDVQNAGVDWTVTCGGNPLTGSVAGGACGSFTPTHTSDGGVTIYTAPATIPLNTSVTLTASVTSNPSANSRVTLPIVGLPITVDFSSALTSLGVSASAKFVANALNDTSGAGVKFAVTCASATCGTFSNVSTTSVTYTAPSAVPAGGTVTITATSVTVPSESASVTVTILPASSTGGIAVSINPSNFFAEPTGAARTISLVATVTNDPAEAGVTWTVVCGSPGACGTLTAGTNTNDIITASYQAPGAVPTGGTVTITATSVTNTSVSAIATATITTSAVTVVKFTTAPSASLAENATATLVATETPAGQTISWTATCGSAGACGSFNPVSTASGGSTTYTAPAVIPAGDTVTITAASATAVSNSAITVTTITTPSPSIAFVQPPPSTLTATLQAPVSATVTNDATTPGGVTWSVSCGSTTPGGCGYVQPYQTADGVTTMYTAPPVSPSGTVTIVAASTAFPTLKVSVPVTITPSTGSSVSFIPALPSQLPSYAVVNLNAAVSNDTTNAGVDWQVCASGCGFFTIKPAVAAIPATPTTPYIPAVPAVTSTTTNTQLSPYWPNGWPNGLAISYTAPLAASQGLTVTVTAAAHASTSISTTANIAIGNLVTGPTLNGIVRAGTQPVVGASVGLYAAGISGYGSASTLLFAPGNSSHATTNNSGVFTLPGGYSCPQADSQVYLVATGGSVGTNAANPNLSMMTALGPCSNLNSGSVVVNEVTTIGSVWPLAPFASDDVLTGKTSYLNIGASSTNTVGLANAFASVNNLVNVSSGQARFTVPAGNGSVPYAEINLLADILNTCTSSSGGAYEDGTACGTLFEYTAPLPLGGIYNATVPTDTIQAAINVAQHPVDGFGYQTQVGILAGLASLSSPFQPILTTTPNDFSISLNFTAVGGLAGTSGANFFAIDAAGDLWITEANANRVVEWNNLGAAISPATGFTAGGITSPGPLAIDASGDIWISGSNGLTELYDTGTPAEGSPFSGGNNGAGMSIDGSSNIWITIGPGVAKFNNVGTELSPAIGYINSGVSGTAPIVIDGSNDVLLGNHASGVFSIADLSNASGQLVVNTAVGSDTDTTQDQIAVDALGDIWVPVSTTPEICKIPAYGGLGMVQIVTCYAGGPLGGGSASLSSIENSRGIALDGAGNLWVGNTGGGGVSPNLSEIDLSLLSNSNIPNSFAGFNSSSLSAGPVMVAVDGAGNVWVLLSNNTITEYVGIATPAVTPTALAVKNKKIGATP